MRKVWSAAVLLLALGAGQAQVLTRPPLLQERLAPELRPDSPSLHLVWPRVLMELGLGEEAARGNAQAGYSDCVYATALDTLKRLRRDAGVNGSYIVTWASNQDRVFSACDGRAGGPREPQPPQGKGLPARAASDFQYQLASWHFYRRQFVAALPVFQQLSRDRQAPQRANAAYTVVRSLAHLQRLDEAYAAIEQLLADRSLREVHGLAANYRFVIMSNTNGFAPAGSLSPALAQRHLRWLHDTARVDVERAANPAQAAADARDAREQLAMYFPRQDAEGRVDWWLLDGEVASARMKAVKDLAPQWPLIDWMQASWATNVFDADWLWGLHDAGHPYWTANARIVAHAWSRWQQDRDGAWLQVAIRRVHANDPLARPILAAAHAYLGHPWQRPAQQETMEYRSWVFTLWHHALRLHLGLGETRQAIELASRAKEMAVQEPYLSQNAPLFHVPVAPDTTLHGMLRWLVYQGDIPAARALLQVALQQFPEGMRQWRTLLATTAREAQAAALVAPFSSSEGSAFNDPAGWERLIDEVSSETLYGLSAANQLQERYRALLARTALARALMLGYDNDVVDRYAALAGQLNPPIREQLLAGVASHARSDYVRLMLRMPRLRPAVMAEYAGAGQGKDLPLDAIDVHNHNDNNWWCAFSRTRLRERAFLALRVVPQGPVPFAAEQLEAEIEPHLARQREVLDAHPYRTLADPQEAEALERLPSGPRFLSEAVIARENESAGEPTAAERSERAADLHRAVRTTRYGCDRDGPHATYSRAAHKLLQGRYGDTPWAKATPYWFK